MRRRWGEATWVGRLFTLQIAANIFILWIFGLAMFNVARDASMQAKIAGEQARAQSESNHELIEANQAILSIVVGNQRSLSNVDRRLLKALRGLRIDCDETALVLRCVLKVPKLPPHIVVVPQPFPSPSPSPVPCRPPQCKPTRTPPPNEPTPPTT